MRKAFTLIELIVVISIIAVLSAIAFPVTARVVQSSKASACASNLRQLGAALNLYLADHKEIMPDLLEGRTSTSGTGAVIDNTLNTYVQDPRIFLCPADNLPASAGTGAGSGTSYGWNNALDGQSATNLEFLPGFLTTGSNGSGGGQNAEIPIMGDKQGFHPYTANKVNLLYADGHISQDITFGISQ